MDRRKLRRLLASSSFAAILIAAQSARGQADLTNPAGSTVPFLRVDPGETVNNVRNEGLIENSAGDPGIEVSGTAGNPATVLGEIDNDGGITVTGPTQATGILVHGSSASVGEGIDNHGHIDVAGRLTAYGIALQGTNVSISGGGDQPAILNEGTIDVLQRDVSGTTIAFASPVANVLALRNGVGKAAGIVAGDDVTIDGPVVNAGALDVAGTFDFATVIDATGTTGKASVHQKVLLDEAVAGIDLEGALLSGLTNEGGIDVSAKNGFSAALSANGKTGAMVTVEYDIETHATGIALDYATIEGPIHQEANIAVDLAQSVTVTATALGPGAKVSATKITAAAVANGMRLDGSLLESDFANAGEIQVDIDGRLAVLGKATGEGTVGVDIFATTNDVTAHGIEILTDTVSGDIANEGAIDVTAHGAARFNAKAVSDDGAANADANGYVGVEASGVIVEASSLVGDFRNEGRIDIFARADVTVSAYADGKDAQAFGNAIGVNVDVFALTAEITTATGNLSNAGDARVQGLYAGKAKATAVGDTGANAGAAVGGTVSADGVELDVDTLVGSLSNQGSVFASGSVDLAASALASASAGKAAARAIMRSDLGGTVTGVNLLAESLSGSMSNSGDVVVQFKAVLELQADAKAPAATASAQLSNLFGSGHITAEALGVALTADTGVALANHGKVTATATVILHGTAAAAGKAANASVSLPFFPVAANAQGVDIGVGSVSGSLTNTGDVRAFNVFAVDLRAEARAGSGLAHASLVVAGMGLFAQGVEIDGDTVDGRIFNSGSALIVSRGKVSVAAIATGEGAANASVLFEAVTASSTGLDIDVDFAGSVTNHGGFEVLLGATVDIGISAVGSVAKATALNAHAIDLDAGGMRVEGTSFAGGILNSGELTAAAVLSARATFGMDAYAKGANAATANAFWRSLTAVAAGLAIDVDTIDGDVINQGEVQGGGVLGLRASATAIVKSGGTAEAGAGITSTGNANIARGTGMSVVADSIGGGITNSGAFALGEAVGFLKARAIASATVQGNASATASIGDISVLANGIDIEVGTLGGDAINNGFVAAAARVSASLTASAAGEGGNAKALFDIPSLFANAYDVNGGTIDGDIRNAGSLIAEVSMTLAVKATMNGTGNAIAKVGSLEFRAEGMEAEFASILGDVTNNAAITAQALLAADVSAAAGGNAQASIELLAAQAFGVRILGADSVAGSFLNSGRVLALAKAEAKAVAEHTVKAQVAATADAMTINAGTLSGDVVNEGTLLARAFAKASYQNSGQYVAGARAVATGLRVLVGDLGGDVLNAGLIAVTASAAADGVGGTGTAQSTARAIGVRAFTSGSAAGGVINRGTIEARALSDAPALAVGQAIVGGIWGGALSNTADARIAAFASDPAQATAVGMQINGSIDVEGGVVNAGSIFAEAVSLDAKAVAIDLSNANKTGHVVQMLDGALIAVTRITALGLTSAGTAVLMEGNGQSDELDWSGGVVQAHIVGSKGLDSMDVFAGADAELDFNYSINGLASLDVNTAAHAGTAVELRLGGNVNNVTALNVNENGTLVMGVIGKAAVQTYNQDPDATVIFEIGGPSQNGLISVTNQANLAGAVGVRARSGLYFDTQTYTVIAGNLSGQFDTIRPVNSPLLEIASIEDSSPDVTIVVERNAFDSVPGLSHNQKQLGGAIEDFYDPDALFGTDMGQIVGELFTLPTDELLAAYDDLAGAEHAQMAYAGFESMRFMQGGISQRLADARSAGGGAGQSAGVDALQYAAADAPDDELQGTQLAAIGNDPDRPGSVWGKGYGSWGSLDGDNEAPGYDSTTGAIVVGVDYRFDDQFLIGIAGAYSFSNLDFDDGDTGDVDSFQLGLFGSWDSGTWYVDGLLSYAFQSYDTKRHIDFLGETAKADYDGGAAQVYGEVGYQFRVSDQALVTPLLGLGWTGVWTDDFTETGAGAANLKVDEASYDSLATTLGVRGSLSLGGFEPSLFLGWRHEFLDDHGEADLAFAAVPDSKWQVIGSDVGSDTGLVGVGVVAELSAQLEAVVDYGGQFSGSGSNHSGSVGLRLKF